MGKIETNDHILDCAIDLFWQRSYHGVNMNELSRAANVNKATLYQYFPSKEEIAVAALTRGTKRAQEQVYQASFDETSDPRQRLENIYQKAYVMHLAMFEAEGKCRGCPFVNLGVELSTSSDAIRKAVELAFGTFKTYNKKIIDDYRSKHNHKGVLSAKELAAFLMSNMNGCLVEAKIENRPQAILDGKLRALEVLKM